MNYQEKRQQNIDELEIKLRNNEHIKIWNVYPYRFELRERLIDNKTALEYLEECIEYINESL